MHLRIRTSHNVEIEFETAGVGQRIKATLVDLAILIGYLFGIGYLISEFRILSNTPIIIMLYMAPAFFYHLVFELFFNGQSPGKMVAKTKVARLDGTKPTIGDLILRWIMIPVDQLMALGLVFIAMSQYQQRLGDMLAGTTVIRLTARTSLSDTIYGQLPDNYEPVFMNVLLLNDREAQIIREVLNAAGNDSPNEEKKRLLKKSRQKIEHMLETSSPLPDVEFLIRVIKDYYFLSARLK